MVGVLIRFYVNSPLNVNILQLNLFLVSLEVLLCKIKQKINYIYEI